MAKLPKNISIFEQLRAQQEEGREYYFAESDDEGDAGGTEYGEVCPLGSQRSVPERPPFLVPEEVKDGVLVDDYCIPTSLATLYGDNPPLPPLGCICDPNAYIVCC